MKNRRATLNFVFQPSYPLRDTPQRSGQCRATTSLPSAFLLFEVPDFRLPILTTAPSSYRKRSLPCFGLDKIRLDKRFSQAMARAFAWSAWFATTAPATPMSPTGLASTRCAASLRSEEHTSELQPHSFIT